MPSAWARARAAYAVRWSHGKSGSERETERAAHQGLVGGAALVAVGHSWFCGNGRSATSWWSLSITPSLAAPPGEPRSSKKSTLAV